MPHSIPTTHSNEQKIIQDGRRNLPSILFAKGGTNIYIYPENLRAKAMLWLWPLRDVAIIGTGFILSVLALAQSGFLPPLVPHSFSRSSASAWRTPAFWTSCAMPSIFCF